MPPTPSNPTDLRNVALVAHVEYAMRRGAVRPGDAVDTAQQIWSTVHGAVTLELKGLVLTPDPGDTYARLLDLLIRGVAPGPDGVPRPGPPARRAPGRGA